MKFDFIKDGKSSPVEILPATETDPFDLDRAKQSFIIFESQIKDWARSVKNADIKNQMDAGLFTDTIGKAKSLVKQLESERKRITAQAYNFYKDVLGLERYYGDMIDNMIIKPANLKLSFYFKQIEIERQKAEKAAQKATAKKQIELDKIADAAVVDRVKLDDPVFKDSKPKITGESASAHAKKSWVYAIVNYDEIPRRFLIIDDKGIKRAIKNGERLIAGLVISEETTAQVRSRR